MNEETREHHIVVRVPKDIPTEFVHKIYEQVLEEAVQIFYKKNHDYNSSWRLESVDSVTREILTRCYRTLKLLELESKGQEGKVAEGVESELRDVINWAVFGVLLRRGYGVSIDKALADPTGIDLNRFSEEELIKEAVAKAEAENEVEAQWAEEARQKKEAAANRKDQRKKVAESQEIYTEAGQKVKFTKGTPAPSKLRTQGTVGADWTDVFDPELTQAEKVLMGDPSEGVTLEITREINRLYQTLMQRSNPYPAVIFLEPENPINQIGRFSIGPNVYVHSHALTPGHAPLVVDGKEIDKIVYIRVKENGSFDGKYETDTEAQVLSQLLFMPQQQPSGQVDLYSQNIAAQLFLGNQ